MATAQIAALIAATVTMGLISGLLFAFSMAVMPGLRRTSDPTFVETMRAINVAIINGWLALTLFGTLVFTATAAGLHLLDDGGPALIWIAVALVLYLGALAITGAVNVPLNDGLARASIDGTGADGSDTARRARVAFEDRWHRWNVIRTLLSTAGFVSLLLALREG